MVSTQLTNNILTKLQLSVKLDQDQIWWLCWCHLEFRVSCLSDNVNLLAPFIPRL